MGYVGNIFIPSIVAFRVGSNVIEGVVVGARDQTHYIIHSAVYKGKTNKYIYDPRDAYNKMVTIKKESEFKIIFSGDSPLYKVENKIVYVPRIKDFHGLACMFGYISENFDTRNIEFGAFNKLNNIYIKHGGDDAVYVSIMGADSSRIPIQLIRWTPQYPRIELLVEYLKSKN